MTLQTRRQAEKEKQKKNEKRKDNSQEKESHTGKRQKLSSTKDKDTGLNNTENSSAAISKEDKKSIVGEAEAESVELDHPLTFNEDEKVLCFHGPLIYEAKVNI